MRGDLHARLAAALGARVKAHGIVDIDDLAQVAIDTIREPTDGMLGAGIRQTLAAPGPVKVLAVKGTDTAERVASLVSEYEKDFNRFLREANMADVYRAMVDAER